MLLTITTTHRPATDIGYLLHKNPASVQSFALQFGQVHVFYPEVSDERCTFALLLDIDTIQLVRSRNREVALEHYVNDRPYVASSFLSVALAQVLGSALNGRCAQRPELVTRAWPLQVRIAAVPCREGETWLRRLFEPLRYTVNVEPHMLDEQHPEWGMSAYFVVTLEKTCPLHELLTHLYVLIPVLDNDKHYWIGDDEVEKLLKRGRGWLETHPECEQIVPRYLRHRRSLVRDALSRLLSEEVVEAEREQEDSGVQVTKSDERRVSLHEQRLHAVMAVLQTSGARRVLDLGCGEGKLLKLLLQDKTFEQIVGMDVSYRALEIARSRLRFDSLPAKQRERITLLHGSLTYRDERLAGYDAATVVEVIEHLDPLRLASFERVLFEFARPALVVVTTPNAEYNVKFATLNAGTLRHPDHRFEWSRSDFQTWATRVGERFGYSIRFAPVGPEESDVGAPSQMGIFTRA